jgi:hypothetical protein
MWTDSHNTTDLPTAREIAGQTLGLECKLLYTTWSRIRAAKRRDVHQIREPRRFDVTPAGLPHGFGQAIAYLEPVIDADRAEE